MAAGRPNEDTGHFAGCGAPGRRVAVGGEPLLYGGGQCVGGHAQQGARSRTQAGLPAQRPCPQPDHRALPHHWPGALSPGKPVLPGGAGAAGQAPAARRLPPADFYWRQRQLRRSCGRDPAVQRGRHCAGRHHPVLGPGAALRRCQYSRGAVQPHHGLRQRGRRQLGAFRQRGRRPRHCTIFGDRRPPAHCLHCRSRRLVDQPGAGARLSRRPG